MSITEKAWPIFNVLSNTDMPLASRAYARTERHEPVA
eukprot:CAMPEP_0178990280 /NCGR_PEP_ID=MMETSP0795-20121207/4846_1 /TAXON_ID=88552 /ORGANISM="Amoebophrya sp., Strain Ameob2" /LENGTH=36 /DNA_ID= /DNA_START= /DNA_END= /DNA_ORIENTATION=